MVCNEWRWVERNNRITKIREQRTLCVPWENLPRRKQKKNTSGRTCSGPPPCVHAPYFVWKGPKEASANLSWYRTCTSTCTRHAPATGKWSTVHLFRTRSSGPCKCHSDILIILKRERRKVEKAGFKIWLQRHCYCKIRENSVTLLKVGGSQRRWQFRRFGC